VANAETVRAGKRKQIRDQLIAELGAEAVIWVTSIDRESSLGHDERAKPTSRAVQVNLHVAAECFVGGTHRRSTEDEIEQAENQAKERQQKAKTDEIRAKQTAVIMTPEIAESMGLSAPKTRRKSKNEEPPEGE